MKTILGKKIGMTQIFTESGEAVPVTVIEAGPVVITQVKTTDTDGYEAVQIAFADQKAHRVNKPMTGHFNKYGVSVKKHLAEFRNEEGDAYKSGQTITVADFEEGKKLDVTVTVQNVVLVKVIEDRNLMLVRGAIPGGKGGLLRIQYAVKGQDK